MYKDEYIFKNLNTLEPKKKLHKHLNIKINMVKNQFLQGF